MKSRKLNKHWKIDELENLINKKIPPDVRLTLASSTLGTVIASLGKHLIKTYGYSVTDTVLKRELRELGKKDAVKLKKILGLEQTTEGNVKSIINIAAIILGLKLGLIDKQKVGVVKCPFYDSLKEYKQPFMCNACIEYNKGLVKELIGNEFSVKRVKWLFDGNESCVFDVTKRLK